jgi:hypothetical protein
MADEITRSETQQRMRRRVEEFLEGGTWSIAPDREQTRRALIEVLSFTPEIVLERVFAEGHVFVLAPPCDAAGTVLEYQVRNAKASGEFDLAVIFLDARIERYPWKEVRRIVSQAMSLLFTQLAGIGGHQALHVAFQESGELPS